MENHSQILEADNECQRLREFLRSETPSFRAG